MDLPSDKYQARSTVNDFTNIEDIEEVEIMYIEETKLCQ